MRCAFLAHSLRKRAIVSMTMLLLGCLAEPTMPLVPFPAQGPPPRSDDPALIQEKGKAPDEGKKTPIQQVSHQAPADQRPPVPPPAPPPTEKPESAAPMPVPEIVPPPEKARTTSVTLDQAVREALLADPRIRAGLESINQADADLLTASLLPNPGLVVYQSLLPLTRPFTVTAQGGPPQLDVGVGFAIDWLLFGKRAAAMASACLGVEVAAAEYENLVRERVLATILACFDVLEAKALLELLREDLADLQELEKITRQALEAGRVPAIDVQRVQLAVFDRRREVRHQEVILNAAKAHLRALLGRSDADPSFDVIGSLSVSAAATPIGVEEALAVAEENRPDIIARRRQLSKAGADVLLERTRAYPLIMPRFGYTRQFQEKAIGYPDASSWGAGVEVGLPLFDRNQGNRARSRSVVAQTSLTLQADLIQLRAEIEQVVYAFRIAHLNVTKDDPAQLKAAREVRDRIRDAWKAGTKTLIEVLDAQRAYRETHRLFITGQSNYWRALHRLNAAVAKQVLR